MSIRKGQVNALKRIVCGIIALLLISSMFGVFAENTDEELAQRFASAVTMEYNGKTYRLRNRLETILVLGTDRRNDESGGLIGTQADFLMLIVLDDNHKTVTPIRINRDTMTQITATDLNGENPRNAIGQICLSYAYGDGEDGSCQLTAQAVSSLFFGVPIDHYYAVNMDGIATLNDAIGGVTVTLQDDFTMLDPSMAVGATVHLQGKQAEYFVRSRMEVGDGSNENRMRRQKAYMDAAKPILTGMLQNSPNSFGALYEKLEDFAVTDMAKGRIINTAVKIQRYDVLSSLASDGENREGLNGHVEFYPEEQSLRQIAVSVFFEED